MPDLSQPQGNLLTDMPLPLTIRQRYGEDIENMVAAVHSLIIPNADQAAVLMYTRRRYKETRLYTTKTINSETRLYRIR